MAPAVDAPPPYDGMRELNLGGDGQDLHRIVVGVDFGTTFTGVSFVSTEGSHLKDKVAEDVTCIDDWPGPGRGGDTSWKCPSRIAYAADNDLTSNAWGYEVKPGSKAFAWFKLLLDQQQATEYDDPDLCVTEGQGVLSKPYDKSAVDLCADFLAEVATFAYHSIARRVTPEVLKASPLDFWFTVPAMWSDRAKAYTLKAAQKAAKLARLQCHPDSQVCLISEPEAAAIATFSSLIQGAHSQLVKVGDSVLVCDCGGGTVDLTSYEVTGITPKLTFKELIAGVGGKCGSTYIDREFHHWMERKIGVPYTDLPFEKRGPASPLMKEFEGAKRDFGKSTDARRVFELQVFLRGFPDSNYYDQDLCELSISYTDMKSMFDPVVEKVVALLQSQLDSERRTTGKSTIRTIFLVGGFGDSAYLNHVLQGWCQQRQIRLLCPEHPQSAIVRGAALSGLHNIQPSSRRCRRHYGFATHVRFDPSRHREQDRFIWAWNGEARANGVMSWELSKGDVVGPDTKITFDLTDTVYDDEMSRPSILELFGSDADEPPLYVHDAGTKLLASIKEDVTGVDMRQFPAKSVRGRTLRQIAFKYTISFGHRQGVLRFASTINGKEVGAISVAFDGENEEDSEDRVSSGGVSSPPCAMQ